MVVDIVSLKTSDTRTHTPTEVSGSEEDRTPNNRGFRTPHDALRDFERSSVPFSLVSCRKSKYIQFRPSTSEVKVEIRRPDLSCGTDDVC